MTKFLLLMPFIILFLFLTIYTQLVIFENTPHSQDETAYLFQAKIVRSGHFYLNSLPKDARRFFDHEFIVNNGKQYGKYPPGQSLLLSFGLLFNKPWLVNPLFGAGSLVLLFILAQKLFSLKTAFLASILCIVSPFFILISASFLSHATTLFFSLLFFLSLFEIHKYKYLAKSRWNFLAGLSLGMILVIRPYNTLVLMICFIVFSFYNYRYFLLNQELFKKRVATFFLPLSFITAFFLFYNQLLTGSFFTLPQQVYSPFDFIGFGIHGVEWGLEFTLSQAFSNLIINTQSLHNFLFAWPTFWIVLFALPGLFFSKDKFFSLLMVIFLVVQILMYFFYFHPGTFLGPRYWFEASWVLILLAAEGFIFMFNLIEKVAKQKDFLNFLFILFLTVILVLSIQRDLNFLLVFKGYNGMAKPQIPKLDKPSVIFIEGKSNWQSYGKYFTLQSPILEENQIIFARDKAIYNVYPNSLPLPNITLKKYFPYRKLYLLKNDSLQELD